MWSPRQVTHLPPVWGIYFPWHRHQLEGTNGFYCLIRKTERFTISNAESQVFKVETISRPEEIYHDTGLNVEHIHMHKYTHIKNTTLLFYITPNLLQITPSGSACAPQGYHLLSTNIVNKFHKGAKSPELLGDIEQATTVSTAAVPQLSNNNANTYELKGQRWNKDWYKLLKTDQTQRQRVSDSELFASHYLAQH